MRTPHWNPKIQYFPKFLMFWDRSPGSDVWHANVCPMFCLIIFESKITVRNKGKVKLCDLIVFSNIVFNHHYISCLLFPWHTKFLHLILTSSPMGPALTSLECSLFKPPVFDDLHGFPAQCRPAFPHMATCNRTCHTQFCRVECTVYIPALPGVLFHRRICFWHMLVRSRFRGRWRL